MNERNSRQVFPKEGGHALAMADFTGAYGKAEGDSKGGRIKTALQEQFLMTWRPQGPILRTNRHLVRLFWINKCHHSNNCNFKGKKLTTDKNVASEIKEEKLRKVSH